MNPPFKLGKYRPIYLWGGPGTIRMNKVKFMDYPVDEAAHNEVHTLTGARLVVDDLYCNWIHLMYDWGFPPEIHGLPCSTCPQRTLKRPCWRFYRSTFIPG